MRLASFRIHGYRRFARLSTMDLGPKVVAIVGPNESGKTSLLKAMLRLNSEDEEPSPFKTAERTGRPQTSPTKRPVVSALFVLEDDDHKALADIPGSERVRLYEVSRNEDGYVRHEFRPHVSRPRATRDEVARNLDRVLASSNKQLRAALAAPWRSVGDDVDEDENPGAPEPATLGEALVALRKTLRAESEDVDKNSLAMAEGVAGRFEDVELSAPKYAAGLPTRLARLVAEQRETDPQQRIYDRLWDRRPRFELIEDRERQLVTDYAFEDYPEGPPAPLRNLLSLTGITFEDLREAAQDPGDPRLADLQRRINLRLEQELHASWRRRSRVSIAISVDGGVVRIFPYDADSDTHTRIDDRSEGFRSFLALLAFAASRSRRGTPPVLLIDEAELHLHVDAQADLVEIFGRQDIAAKIVYTTHSPACLPEDLGSGIRVAAPLPGDRSEIRNAFWHEGQPGFTPLLIAMGASLAAFTPTRRGVIGEGPSDALLVPLLIRAAEDLAPYTSLGFQVAGGLAWVSDAALAELELEAARVVYLVDSDAAGSIYAERLSTAGVPKGRVITMRAGTTTGLTVEDFVHHELLCDAVNYLIEHMRESQHRLAARELPRAGRAAAIDRWCEQKRLRPLPRPAIAEEVVRRAHPSPTSVEDVTLSGPPIVEPSRRAALRQMHRKLREALELQEPTGTWGP